MPEVTANPIRARARALILSRLPSSWRSAELADETPLMEGGVGLDSVALVELLVACEDELGAAIPVERLQETTLTVGVLVDRIARAAVAGRR